MPENKIKPTRPGRFHNAGPGNLGPEDFSRWYRAECAAAWEGVDLRVLSSIAGELLKVRDLGRKVLVMGNGGSAAISSHIAVDFAKTARVPGRPLIRSVALTDNVEFLTAVANDLSFDDVFVAKMEALLEPGDLALLISGSGNSKNLVKAARYAKSRGAKTVALLGFDGGKLKSLVDLALVVPSDQYGVIEELHMGVGHILTFYVRQLESRPTRRAPARPRARPRPSQPRG
ncbi:MAG: SIS domain-containing protein [Elusimicrobia bacterium]|nr:SIS domain-containing protein [Elusimicrobiota bacterium]